MRKVRLGSVEVSAFILGGNPQSGISHINADRDAEMKRYFTLARRKGLLRQAEALGITTHFARGDRLVTRALTDYWREGGTIQWVAQTCPELGDIEGVVRRAIAVGAKAVYVHGGQMDHYLAHRRLDEIAPVINMIHDAGLPAGVAGHHPEVFAWAEEHLACDFYMCAYYNPVPRENTPEHIAGVERFDAEDRERMAEMIAGLTRPVVHYKIMAAGRNDPAQALRYAADKMRPGDAVCVGIYPKSQPGQLAETLSLFEASLAAARK